ncbi:signal peptidase I [Chitinophaga sp.]|uniref:signal peptidase I n=1 Tax=Chitinophaga sp. TaxID=1869181 RepID=UPI002F937D97
MHLFNDNELIARPRKPFVAALLSIFTPGLGQIYNGRHLHGILLYAGTWLPFIVFGYTRWCASFYGWLLMYALATVVWCYTLINAMITAKKLQSYGRKVYNNWFYYAFVAILMLRAMVYMDFENTLGLVPYDAVDRSAKPTIRYGETAMVDRQAFVHQAPAYGDLVMYRSSGFIMLGRIAALPKDAIAFRDNIPVINMQQVKTTFIKDTIIDGQEQQLWVEVMPNGRKHQFIKLKHSMTPDLADQKTQFMPDSTYFLLSDNRDQSMDSRSIPPVHRNNIIGKAKFIPFRKAPLSMNITLE